MNTDEITSAREQGNVVNYEGEKKTELVSEYDVEVKQGYDDDNEINVLPEIEEVAAKKDLEIAQDELDELEGKINAIGIERTLAIIHELRILHEYDQNFPGHVLERMHQFLSIPDVTENPDKHGDLVREMKLEAILATENSPYLEVRANCDPTDDTTLPVFTVRVWVLGSIFCAAGCFIDTLFGYRNPPVSVSSNVAQLIAYPCGKFMHKILPDWRFRLFGQEHSLNPGPFNPKEHMLITIMANIALQAPYTNYIVPAQALPQFFNEPWARKRGYQFLNTLGTNFVGYGIAGVARRFLVYPSVAVWPGNFNTIALIKAFHTETNEPVKGLFGWTYRASREKVFLLAFVAMFVYFLFPGFIFGAISNFSWMTWISPDNVKLAAVTGFSGMGLNPWPTFDWNNLTVWLSPLTIPTFSIMNMGVGILIGAIMTLIVWFKNGWNTAYLPINGNSPYDNMGNRYNVTKILNAKKELDVDLYQAYSQPWMSAGFAISYLWYFALYSATLTYTVLFHRHEIYSGMKTAWKSVRRSFKKGDTVNNDDDDELAEDAHYRIMKANYKEAPEWWYLVTLLIFMAIGMVGVGIYPTNTSPVVLLFGIVMPLLCIVPCGIIQAVTGIPVPLNVLAEFIGGSWVQGNANGLMYFKTYGYIATYQALAFSSDLKLAHYIHIAPRITFMAQMWATLIYCLVSSSIFNFALGFKDVCTPAAQFKFTCPNQRTFYSAAVFWGTISPKRLFGPGCRYNLMLLGFPLGFLLVVAYYFMRRRWPRNEFLRQIHPVMLCAGPSTWGSPYNMAYYIGNIYVVWFSFQYVRKRYLAFWAKYNYVIAAAFPAGIAISAIFIFFALEIPKGGLYIDWWGNNVVGLGCEGEGGCPYLDTLPDVGYFGGAPGTYT